MVNDFWLKNKHTISIFQAQVRDLAKHIEAQPKKTMLIKKNVYSTTHEKLKVHDEIKILELAVGSYQIRKFIFYIYSWSLFLDSLDRNFVDAVSVILKP